MKNNLINESEVSQILSMHKSLKEQTEMKKVTDTSGDLVMLRKAITAGCLKGGRILTNSDQTLYVYRATSKSGKTVDFTADMNYKFTDGSKSGKWKCDEITRMEVTTSDESNQQKPLNANQLFILNELEKLGWSNTPVPTDVEVDNKMFLKMDLSGKGVNTNEGLSPADVGLADRYKKWFADYPNGFFVYKRNLGFQSPDKIEREDKVEVTIESCKTAIERLHNNLLNPRTHPLTTKQKTNFRETAITCNEPANKGKFFAKFALNRKVKKLEQQRVI
jgi:hypothetical protein